MPFDLSFPTEEIIKIIASYLQLVTSHNDKHASMIPNMQMTRFHAKNIPSIDILGYLARILKYAPCGTECFLAIIIYLERISVNQEILYNPVLSSPIEIKPKQKRTMQITSYNIHRLIISGSLLSIKFLSDVFYTNMHISSFYERLTLGVGGIPLNELNILELELLELLDFSLMVSPEELVRCGTILLEFHDTQSIQPNIPLLHYRFGLEHEPKERETCK